MNTFVNTLIKSLSYQYDKKYKIFSFDLQRLVIYLTNMLTKMCNENILILQKYVFFCLSSSFGRVKIFDFIK